jgi:hypothetical protein
MRKAVLALWAFALTTSAVAGELYVLPVVADGVAGRFGSLWETQIRLVKVNPNDSVVIRRAWVCLEGGGFVDDPGTAPAWELPWSPDDYWAPRAMLLTAAELLVGTGAQTGGVALDVEGGELLIDVSIVDVRLGGFVGGDPAMPYGIGQAYSAARAPLEGASHVSWIGGCYGAGDIRDDCDNHYRNNVGLLNPNPEPLVFELTALPFVHGALAESDEFISLPPYGWRQAEFPLNEWIMVLYSPFSFWSFPLYGVVNVEPQSGLPYYAYVSVVYTSPVGASTPRISDPSFQLAQPGYIMEHSDMP